jgi:tetratricopeptide (TPR) repeat protein
MFFFSRPAIFRALLIAAACIILPFAGPANGQDASALFSAGERAFAGADYDEALRLFMAARDAGSSGPSSYYNIGVCQYRLGDYAAAEATFAALAAEFPAMRELAEYNRGLALRAAGNVDDARVAFERARSSADDKIVSLASAQLGEIGVPLRADAARWTGYLGGGVGYDDNVALLDETLLPNREASSSLAEILGVLTRDFGATPLLFDASAYAVHYPEVGDFDQTAVRLSLAAQLRLADWTLVVGPTLGRSTLNGEGYEELVGADMRLRRRLGARFEFEARAFYDAADAASARFGYLDGSRSRLRLAIQHFATARIRGGYDVERNDRADPGVSPSRERWFFVYQRAVSQAWRADVGFAHRTSRYAEAGVPREERLLELTLAARREVGRNWTLGVEYRSFDNDSTVDEFSYDGQRVSLGFSRSFYND